MTGYTGTMEPEEPIEAVDGGVLLHVYARPRASRTKVAGLHGARIKLQIAAPPVDGAANAAIVAFLADVLGVSKSAVSFRSGETGKRKSLLVEGIDADHAHQRLGV